MAHLLAFIKRSQWQLTFEYVIIVDNFYSRLFIFHDVCVSSFIAFILYFLLKNSSVVICTAEYEYH